MSQYNSELPKSCPPGDAAYMKCTLYKAINGRQPNSNDFMSFAEQRREGIDISVCESWGLSVWPHEKAVKHALKAYKFFRKKRIIKFTVTEKDGCLKATPSNQQPEHHTFWKMKPANLVGTSQLVTISVDDHAS